MKTADFIAEQQSQNETHASGSKQPKKQARRNPAEHLVKWQWGKGESGNPGGRPKKDFAAEFARKVLLAEGNEALLSEYAHGFSAQLKKGNAYTFKELAERGFGKLKEIREVTHLHQDVADTDLQARIDAIIRDLGLEREIEAAGRTEVSQGRASKANGKTQDTDVLSR